MTRSSASGALIVFDFDGTLVDSNRIKREAYDAALSGYPGASAAIRKALRTHPAGDRHTVLAAAVADLVPAGAARGAATVRAVRAYGRYCLTQVGRAPEFKGVSSTLRRLARRHHLAVASATPQRAVRVLVGRRDWPFEAATVLGAPRSKAHNLTRLARRFDVPIRRVVLVGDSHVDRDAALEVGCHFIPVALDGARPIRGALRRFADVPASITHCLSHARS